MRPAPESSAAGPPFLFVVPAATAAVYAWLVFATTFAAPGAIGLNFNAVGTDWLVYYGAVQSYLDGDLARIFDGDRFTAFLNQHYGLWLSENLPFRPWVYPPSYLLVLLPFGALPFGVSLAAFQIVTAAALAAAVTAGAPPRDRSSLPIAACAILCPAAAINAVCGQNAFLSVAILVAGFRLLETRPLLAGAALGLMTVKPQFAVLAPIALVACRQWRALFAAAVSASVLVLASALLFGVAAWITWLHVMASDLLSADAKWIEYGKMWGSSVSTCATILGAPPWAATLLQLAFSVGAAAAVFMAFRRRMGCRLPVLLAATPLASPYWCAYDALPLALAGVYWLVQQPAAKARTWPWILALSLWLVPLIGPPILVPAGRFSPLLIAGFLGAALWLESAASRPASRARPLAAAGAASSS